MLRGPETAAGDLLRASLGKLYFYGGTVDPDDGLICDGRLIRHSEFPELTEFLNKMYQTGNPRNDINIPDCRGLFLRGKGNGSGSIGIIQEQSIQSHRHTIQVTNHNENGIYTPGNAVGSAGHSAIEYRNVWNTDYTGTDETRPKNMAFNVVIGTGKLIQKKK